MESLGGKVTPGFQYSPEKNLPISFQQSTSLKFQIWWDCFFWKLHWLSQKLWHEFNVMTLKDHGKFGGKETTGFQFSKEKNLWILFQQGRGSEFQIWWDWFLQKVNWSSKKLSQEFDFMTLKGHGRFWGKGTTGFQLSPRKNLWILLQRARGSKFQLWWDWLL